MMLAPIAVAVATVSPGQWLPSVQCVRKESTLERIGSNPASSNPTPGGTAAAPQKAR